MDKDTKRLTEVLGAIGIAAGLGLGAAGIAAAATDTGSSTSSGPAATAESAGGADQQDPAVNGSVKVAEQPGETGDDAEAAALQAAAKITPDQAKQAALAAVPGTATKVELGNENGSVVYDVEVATNGTITDVTVDAGNAAVLARQPAEADTGGTDGAKDGKDGAKDETGGKDAGNGEAGTETPSASGATG